MGTNSYRQHTIYADILDRNYYLWEEGASLLQMNGNTLTPSAFTQLPKEKSVLTIASVLHDKEFKYHLTYIFIMLCWERNS